MIVIIRVMAAIAAADDPRVTPDRPGGDEIGLRLLDAAAEVFAERGFEGAGVAEIARRAGVTTGAIYSRFTGKADLLASALDARTPDELEALFADHRFEGRAEDILTVVGSHLVDRTPTTGEPLLLEAFVAARRDPAVAALLRERMGEHHERLTAIIEAAKAGGGISSELDTEALATFCHAVGFGFLLFEAFDAPLPAAAPWEQLIAHLVTALRITEPSASAKEG
jgi:AcrR family transcriptional regulator